MMDNKFVVIVALMVGSYVFINLLYSIIGRMIKFHVCRRPLTDAESMAQLNMYIEEWKNSCGDISGMIKEKRDIEE